MMNESKADAFFRSIFATRSENVTIKTKLHVLPFALIIGINTYKNHPLKGAVTDANDFYALLTQQFSVPEQNVTLLLDREATRARIISELKSLARKNIPRDATILIYYAGHGASAEIPAEWVDYHTANNRVELLCPADMFEEDPQTGAVIPGIPDRVFNHLIHDISEVHGDNIVTIFDCCHSGGMNRDFDLSTTSRTIVNPPPVSSLTDNVILDRNIYTVLGEPLSRDSHASACVHLAAVSKGNQSVERLGQLAQGNKAEVWGGVFTTYLLHTLRINAFRLDTLTYQSLMDVIYASMQHTIGSTDYMRKPQYEGLHIHRRLFSTESRDCYITGAYDCSTREMQLHNGGIHGILSDSKFALFNCDKSHAGLPLIMRNGEHIVVGVKKLGIESTTLEPPIDAVIPSSFYAKRIPAGRVNLHLGDDRLISAYNKASLTVEDHLKIGLTKNKSNCDFYVTVENDDIVFFWGKENALTRIMGHRMPRTIPLKEIERLFDVIHAFSEYTYHLDRNSDEDKDNSDPDSDKIVRVELKKLKGGLRKSIIGDNLLGENSFVPINSMKQSSFCLIIENLTEHPLYVYVFFFNFDLGIRPILLPGHGSNYGKVEDPTLGGKMTLKLGYGDSGVRPFRFSLPEGTEQCMGYLKIFFTTAPVDLYSLIQPSPFDVDPKPVAGAAPETRQIRGDSCGNRLHVQRVSVNPRFTPRTYPQRHIVEEGAHGPHTAPVEVYWSAFKEVVVYKLENATN